MKKISIITLFLIALNTFSQSANNSNSFGSGFRIGIENQKGHPYLQNDWYSANLVKNDGTLTEKTLLNYNLTENILVSLKVVNGEKTFNKLEKENYSGFIITDDKNKVHLYTKLPGTAFNKKKSEDKFYLIIDAPEKNIIVEIIKDYEDPNANGWSSSTLSTKRGGYKEKSKTYILNNNGKYENVKLNNKSITKVFEDKKKELKTYISKRNIKIENASDLIPVIQYYKTLK